MKDPSRKKELSYHDIWLALERSGWKRVYVSDDDYEDDFEYHFYEMTLLSHDYRTTVRAWVSEDGEGFEACGSFGIACFEIAGYEQAEFPFGETELKDMLYAMELAEDNLIAIGVPFTSDYKFSGKNAANKSRRNRALRKKFNLLADERKTERARLTALRMTEEEIEKTIQKEYPD